MNARNSRSPVAWVPDQEDAGILAARVPEVEIEAWSGTGAMPGSADDVEFVVAPLFATDEFWCALPKLPKLRHLQLISSGYDNAIGHVPQNVALANGRGIHDVPVSEWVLAAILAQQRDLPKSFADQRAHRWDRKTVRTLNHQHVLLVGYGSIAHAVEERLAPFGVTVDRIATTARDRVHGVEELPALVGSADIIVLLLPDSAMTRGLISRDILALMKDDALIVNAGRGGVLDEGALIDELARGRLRAALDVFAEEPLPTDHPIWDSPRLLLTPHAASDAAGKEERIRDFLTGQLELVAQGSTPANVIHPREYQAEQPRNAE